MNRLWPPARHRRWLWTGLAALVTVCLSLWFGSRFEPAANAHGATPPVRILSLAPSLTETLYALGLGDRVAAVTRYCEFPPEVAAKPRLGTMNELSLESLLALKPDLVLLLSGYEATAQRLEALGIRTLLVRQDTLDNVLRSFPRVAEACGEPERGRQLTATIREQLATLQKTVAGRPPVPVLISTLREHGGQGLSGVRIAGRDGLYSELLTLAGGRNVYDGPLAYPAMSVESLRLLAPEVVVELVPTGFSEQEALAAWAAETAIPAVRNGRVHTLGTVAVVPGPRLAETVEQLARLLHPEVLP